MPDISDIAPDFTCPVTDGGSITLSDLRGQIVVLFFYPRDDTSGCTKESIAFSQALPEFEAAGARVFGVSKDTMASHNKFASKHDLTVPLISDADDTICEDYGVWVEKSMYGRKFMGIERSTVLIDKQGKIAEIWRKVKVPGHEAMVLDAVKALA